MEILYVFMCVHKHIGIVMLIFAIDYIDILKLEIA